MSTEKIKSLIPFYDSHSLFDSPSIYDSPSLFDSPVYLSPSIYDSPVYSSPSIYDSPSYRDPTIYFSPSYYDSPTHYIRPYYPPVPFVFSRPSTYNTIENDSDARLEIIKSFHQLLGDWLMGDLSNILRHLHYRDGQVKVSKSLGSGSNDPENIKHKKIGYIKKNMLTLTDMAKILAKINKESKIRWIVLPHKKSMVRNIVGKYLMGKIDKH